MTAPDRMSGNVSKVFVNTVVFGRNERAFISSVVWVVTALGEIFQSGNSKGKNLFFRA